MDKRRARRRRSERLRRARCVRHRLGIERVRPFGPCRGGPLVHGLGRRRSRVCGRSRRRRRLRLAGALAEAELDILAELLQLVLEPMLGVLELFDPAVRLPQLLLEPVDAQHQLSARRGSLPASPGTSAGGAGCDDCVVTVEIESKPCAQAARAGPTQARATAVRRRVRTKDHRRRPRHLSKARGLIRPAGMGFQAPNVAGSACPGAPLSTVTARRFCDQQEMSSQTATGRSLP